MRSERSTTVPIDPAELAASIGTLYDLDLENGLASTMQRVVVAAALLLRADAAGLMLADTRGQLRWASASDQRAQAIEERQEATATGPCVAAFSQRGPAVVNDLPVQQDGPRQASWDAEVGMRAGLSVPVDLQGGPIGTLDVYAISPRDWDDSEISALQAYAGIAASLLGAVSAAQLKGRLAVQLQEALDHRVLVEQAKGVLMAREGIDASAAFERVRAAARQSRRPVIEVAQGILDGKACW
jgi:transcriptional regulator with GAF, ATPase, and Fis domain